MTTRRKPNTRLQIPTNDYIKQLETQNEELRDTLATSQSLNEYYIKNRIMRFRYGMTYLHTNDEKKEYFTELIFHEELKHIYKHDGGLRRLCEISMNAHEDLKMAFLIPHTFTLALHRNDRSVWCMQFSAVGGMWKFAALDIAGKISIPKEKIYTRDELLDGFEKLSKRYLKYQQP